MQGNMVHMGQGNVLSIAKRMPTYLTLTELKPSAGSHVTHQFSAANNSALRNAPLVAITACSSFNMLLTNVLGQLGVGINPDPTY